MISIIPSIKLIIYTISHHLFFYSNIIIKLKGLIIIVIIVIIVIIAIIVIIVSIALFIALFLVLKLSFVLSLPIWFILFL